MLTSDGRSIVIHPQRTNNILEQFFRGFNHGQRRSSGTEISAARLDAILPDSMLVRNLDDEDYLRIILDGDDSLPQRFSRIDIERVRDTLRVSPPADALFSKPRTAGRILRHPQVPLRLNLSVLERDIERVDKELSQA